MLVSFFAMDISDFSYFIVIKLLKISDLSKFLKGYLMLKILNNDKFTTAQNRHFLVSLKTPILNTLPVRAKVKINRSPILLPLQGVGVYTLIPRALPWAGDWLPFQGAPFRALFVYHVRMLRHFLFGSKTRRDFSVF